MLVEIKSLTEESLNQRDYRDILYIHINGKRVFGVMDGEPEDSNLMRDFNDCFNVPDLMRRAYQAGVSGESIEVETSRVSVDEI